MPLDPVSVSVLRVGAGLLMCRVGLHRWKEHWVAWHERRLVFFSICGPIFGTHEQLGHRCTRCGVRK